MRSALPGEKWHDNADFAIVGQGDHAEEWSLVARREGARSVELLRVNIAYMSGEGMQRELERIWARIQSAANLRPDE